jgi:beta-N-acetylhexosaminidase
MAIQSNSKNLKQLVGQLFVVGFDGKAVPADFKKFVQEYNLGGTIYFKRNVESPEQVAKLSNDLQFHCRTRDGAPLFIAIDQEGGPVDRLCPPFTKFPSVTYLGETDSPKLSFQFGMAVGRELKAVGVNVNFAPVADVATNPSNPVMKDRMFSNDPESVGKMASAVCRGLQKMGVASVAKHFPGHGDTKEDSHFKLPKVDRTLAQLEECELIPFKRVIRSRVEGVMTSHIVNPNIDPDYPATLSEKTIDGLLRNQMRYSKLIFTDDMEMKAVTDHYGAEEAALLAVNAGCDCLVFRGDNGLPIPQIEAIVKAIEDKKMPKARVELAVHRIQQVKRAYAELREPIKMEEIAKHVGIPEHKALAEQILRKEKPANEKMSDSD